MIHAIFFDAVGTLLHPQPSVSQIYTTIAQQFGSRLSQDEVRRRFHAAFAVEDARDRDLGWRTSEDREHQRWRTIVRSVLDDVADLEGCFQALFARFAEPSVWRPDGQAKDVLTELQKRGYVLGLASNFDGRLRSVLTGLPELSALRHLVISSEIGWRKPAPEFFVELCRTAGLAPEHVLYVGDDLHNDYHGARTAGLPTILLTASTPHPEPLRTIARLDELLTLLGDASSASQSS